MSQEAYPPQVIQDRLPAESFESSGGKYSIDQFTYPSDLLSADENSNDVNSNFAVFFINVPTDSRAINNSVARGGDPNLPNGETLPGPISSRLGRGELISRGVEQGQLETALGVAGAVTGGVLGLISSKNIKDSLSLILSSAVLGTVSGSVLQDVGNLGRKMKRLKGAIALNVPENLSISYGVDWTETETALLSAALNITGDLKETLEKFDGTNLNVFKDVITDNINSDKSTAFKSAATAAILRGSPGLGALVGRAPNPMKEQTFQGVNFRDFTMTYKFYPRSPEEATAINHIIFEFKYHMHPEFGVDEYNYLYKYPSEFEIMYFKKPANLEGGKFSYRDAAVENLFIHRHTNCVLTNCEVNYTPNGHFSTHMDGMPNEIHMTLSFRELGLLTKENVEKGL